MIDVRIINYKEAYIKIYYKDYAKIKKIKSIYEIKIINRYIKKNTVSIPQVIKIDFLLSTKNLIIIKLINISKTVITPKIILFFIFFPFILFILKCSFQKNYIINISNFYTVL